MTNGDEYTDSPEKRLDISDGVEYTKQEFIDYYGDTMLWDESHLVPKPLYKEEKRFDILDGNYYTKKQFLDFYGEKDGEKKWKDGRNEELLQYNGIDEHKDKDEDENYQML